MTRSSSRFLRVHSVRAFTLVELLSVIAIVGVLAALTLVAIGRVRESARSSRCGSNIRQIQSLALLWSQDNKGWVPQAMWSMKDIQKSRVGATNLRSVGYSDELGTCGTSEVPAPHYGINNRLVGGGSDGQWGNNYVQYYERGRYKMRDILSSRTITFAETTAVSGWNLNGAGSYMAAANTLGANHSDKAYVAFADGHVELRAPVELQANSVWTEGIPQ